MLEALAVFKVPMDVMITTALAALVGVALLLGGLGAMPFSMPDLSLIANPSLLPLVLTSILATIAGVIVLPVGAGLLGAAAMFFRGKAKAWTFCRNLAALGIVFSFMLMSGSSDPGKLAGYAAGVGISGVLIGFLHTPLVKELYGRSAPTTSEEEQPVELEAEAEDAEATEAAEA